MDGFQRKGNGPVAKDAGQAELLGRRLPDFTVVFGVGEQKLKVFLFRGFFILYVYIYIYISNACMCIYARGFLFLSRYITSSLPVSSIYVTIVRLR